MPITKLGENQRERERESQDGADLIAQSVPTRTKTHNKHEMEQYSSHTASHAIHIYVLPITYYCLSHIVGIQHRTYNRSSIAFCNYHTMCKIYGIRYVIQTALALLIDNGVHQPKS